MWVLVLHLSPYSSALTSSEVMLIFLIFVNHLVNKCLIIVLIYISMNVNEIVQLFGVFGGVFTFPVL